MPFISTKTNIEITKDKETALREALGTLIERLPGKSERWLMLEFSDKCRMAFRGDSSAPLAMVEVSVFGSSTEAAYSHLTEGICSLLSDTLKIPKDRIYVKYAEIGVWGYDGENF